MLKYCAEIVLVHSEDMHVSVTEKREGFPFRFNVSGGNVVASEFTFGNQSQRLVLCLDGKYTRTPSNSFNMIKNPEDGSLGYQVILSMEPALAEVQVFKLHDIPALSQKDLGKFGIRKEDFDIITETEPLEIARQLNAELLSDLPEGVSRFLMQARKSTSY